jgi:hypothetical protein
VGMTESELKSIMAALPLQWQNKINQENQKYDHKKAPNFLAKRKDKFEYKNITVLNMYKLLNKPKIPLDLKYKKWAISDISCMQTLNKEDWKQFFIKIHKRNTNKKASEILFKIAHIIIPTNEKMFNRKLREYKTCPQCGTQDENIAHMMYSCSKVQPLILFILDILDQLYPTEYPHHNTIKFILCGYSVKERDREFGNILLETLILEIFFNRMKSYFKKKMFSIKFLLKKFDNKVKYILKKELLIIKTQNTQDKHINEIRNIFKNGNLNLVADIKNIIGNFCIFDFSFYFASSFLFRFFVVFFSFLVFFIPSFLTDVNILYFG